VAAEVTLTPHLKYSWERDIWKTPGSVWCGEITAKHPITLGGNFGTQWTRSSIKGRVPQSDKRIWLSNKEEFGVSWNSRCPYKRGTLGEPMVLVKNAITSINLNYYNEYCYLNMCEYM
jgi:hypothetical protein